MFGARSATGGGVAETAYGDWSWAGVDIVT